MMFEKNYGHIFFGINISDKQIQRKSSAKTSKDKANDLCFLYQYLSFKNHLISFNLLILYSIQNYKISVVD